MFTVTTYSQQDTTSEEWWEVITKGLGGYWIFKSERVSYDPNTTELKLDDCTMEKFLNDSNSFEPEISRKHIDVSVNLTEYTSTMSNVKQ